MYSAGLLLVSVKSIFPDIFYCSVEHFKLRFHFKHVPRLHSHNVRFSSVCVQNHLAMTLHSKSSFHKKDASTEALTLCSSPSSLGADGAGHQFVGLIRRTGKTAALGEHQEEQKSVVVGTASRSALKTRVHTHGLVS